MVGFGCMLDVEDEREARYQQGVGFFCNHHCHFMIIIAINGDKTNTIICRIEVQEDSKLCSN